MKLFSKDSKKCMKCGRRFKPVLTTFMVMLCNRCLDDQINESLEVLTDDEPAMAWGPL
jgi:hypothetical protein